MPQPLSRRRLLSLTAQSAIAAGASRFFVFEAAAAPQVQDAARFQPAFQALDQFIERYMRNMNSPGMTLALATRDGVLRASTYGFSDIEIKQPVTADQLFHIGSISKSFCAIALLQLHEEGKLDLHKPVTQYLPWLKIESKYAPITVHHLLTHSSGLPDDSKVFLSDPSDTHRPGYAPGEHFHYCNMGFDTLGFLLETLDSRPFAESIRKRVFEKAGMESSEPIITSDIRERTAKNYSPFHDERPYPRYGKLAEAMGITFDGAAGSIASTPRDMGLYLAMLLNHGKAANARVLAEESFALFSTPYIKAPDFGPTASYGYGIGVDTLDGHKVLRHTGGMVSFMSAIHADVDGGVGAFASVNAQQGYRPNPVAQYAIQLLRATTESKPLPPAPAVDAPDKVANAADYAGVYASPEGNKLEFAAETDKLFLLYGGKRIALQSNGGDNFLTLDPRFAIYALRFERASKDPKSAVVEVDYGPEWFVNSRYSGPKTFDSPRAWNGFTGHYRNDSPWIGSTRVVLRKGKLWLDGTTPLEAAPGEENLFYVRDEEFNPEWVRFIHIVNGRAMALKFSGEDLWRVQSR